MDEGPAGRLKAFLSSPDVPRLLARDIESLLKENTALKRQSVQWTDLLEYFFLNEVDMVLHFHAVLDFWTCMLWSKASAYSEGNEPEIAMERAFLALKRAGNKEAV